MKERTQLIFKLLISHVFFLPAVITLSFFLKNDWGLTIAISQTLAVIIFLTGYREFFSSIMILAFFLINEALIVLSGILRFSSGSGSKPGILLIILLAVIELFLLNSLLNILRVVFRKDKESMEIEFPFKNGSYLVTDGGNSKISRLMNYHYHSALHKKRKTNLSMLYATDVVKTDNHSPKFLPPKNEDYPIFAENIYCPMDGEIFKVVNDIPDNKPFSGNYPYNTGNTIIIRNENYYFLLGHLLMGSIRLKEGDYIKRGDLMAQAGNSGYTERPHLHFQLIKSETEDFWKGTGVCMIYNNKNMYKNRSIEVM